MHDCPSTTEEASEAIQKQTQPDDPERAKPQASLPWHVRHISVASQPHPDAVWYVSLSKDGHFCRVLAHLVCCASRHELYMTWMHSGQAGWPRSRYMPKHLTPSMHLMREAHTLVRRCQASFRQRQKVKCESMVKVCPECQHAEPRGSQQPRQHLPEAGVAVQRLHRASQHLLSGSCMCSADEAQCCGRTSTTTGLDVHSLSRRCSTSGMQPASWTPDLRSGCCSCHVS